MKKKYTKNKLFEEISEGKALLTMATHIAALNHFVGLYGVVAAQAISDTCAFILATFIYRRIYNKLQED